MRSEKAPTFIIHNLMLKKKKINKNIESKVADKLLIVMFFFPEHVVTQNSFPPRRGLVHKKPKLREKALRISP